MSKTEHGTFEAPDDLELFYRVWFPDTLPEGKKTKAKNSVLVFIHGMAEHCGRYEFPIQYFTERGYTAYAMDLRGHGDSKGRRGFALSMNQILEDIRSFLNLVKKKEKNKKVFLIGHSFGGQLVLNYGAMHSNHVDGILASSPNVRLKLAVPKIKLLLAPLLAKVWPTLALGNDVDAKGLSHDPQVVRDYQEDKKVFHTITTGLGNIILQNQQKMDLLAANFQVPCFLMHGTEDPICDPEGTRDFFKKIPAKDKTIKLYPGFFHEIFNEIGKEKVFKDMESWLKERA